MSISIERRLLLPRWSIHAVPPLKVNGQPERASDSNSEKARMVFSINVLSNDGCSVAILLIHSTERLSGCIISVYYLVLFCSVKYVFYLIFTASSGGITKKFCFVYSADVYNVTIKTE